MRARGCRVGVLLIAGGLAMLPAACSANSPTTVSATKDAGLSATTVVAVRTSAADVATLPATPAASTTTIAVDFGDLGRDAFCTVATSVVGATGAFVPDATPEAVKNGFASLKASLATLADKGASAQRAQFAKRSRCSARRTPRSRPTATTSPRRRTSSPRSTPTAP
jgi:hypothetical protein